jgi:hypothetical protein
VRFLPLIFALAFSSSLSAAIVYSGPLNLSAAWDDLEGTYLNLATGATATAFPGDFEESPWINLTLGGYGVFNGELINPWTTDSATYDPESTTDYFINVTPGTQLGAAVTFTDTAYGSIHHVGSAPDQFTDSMSGLLGFSFQEEAGGDTYYGWLRITPDGDGSGLLVDWAYNDAPSESIAAGAVPEPSVAGLLVASCSLLVRRRRRS